MSELPKHDLEGVSDMEKGFVSCPKCGFQMVRCTYIYYCMHCDTEVEIAEANEMPSQEEVVSDG